MSCSRAYSHDVFISYPSASIEQALSIRNSLSNRGVLVWLDKEQVRPGEFVAEALERGITGCKVFVLLLTQNIRNSAWVQEEYNRALSLVTKGTLHIVPIVLEGVPIPGFLEARSRINISTIRDRDWERNLDKLVWPGITGKWIRAVWLLPTVGHHCEVDRYSDAFRRLHKNIEISPLSVSKTIQELQETEIGDVLFHRRSNSSRTIAFVNIFEDDGYSPDTSWSPSAYAQAIFRLRELTQKTDDEWVFILCHASQSLSRCSVLDQAIVDRLRHYFVIHHDAPEQSWDTDLKEVWIKAQKYLMESERDHGLLKKFAMEMTVNLQDIFVSAIFPHTRLIKKAVIAFSANGFLDMDDISCRNIDGQIEIDIAGDWVAGRSAYQTKFFSVAAHGNSFILHSSGYKDIKVGPTQEASYCVDISTDIENHSRIQLKLELTDA